MRASLVPAIVLAIAAASVSGQTGTSSDVIALQHVVYGTSLPAVPDTPSKMDAQLRLAEAYATGTGIAQDVEMACGLAQIAGREALDRGDDHPLNLRAMALADDLCANSRDPARAIGVASCPRFGLAREMLEYASGEWLTITRDGWTLEDATGVHDGDWGIECHEVVAAVRLVHVDPPRGSPLRARQFVEMLVWHQDFHIDRTTGPRSLQWYVDELRPARRDINRLASAALVEEKGKSLWPTPPIPETVAAGARFRMLSNGDIKWSFEDAPELGTGVIHAPPRPNPQAIR